MTFKKARRKATRPNHVLSHTHARTCERWYQVRHTDKTEKNVRATRCSVFTPPSLTRESLLPVSETPLKNLRMRTLFTICDLAVCDFAIGDLAMGCLGVHAIESLDVRVATNLVKMMKRKKVARSKYSNLDSSILILLAVPLPHSLVLRNKGVLSSLFLSKTCENFRSGSEMCSCFHWSSLTILVVAHQRDGALVPVPLMPGCGVRDVDRRGEVGLLRILYFSSCCHLITTVSLLCFHAPLLASIALKWSCCH